MRETAARTGEPVVEVAGLSKSYQDGRVRRGVLDRLQLTVVAGEMVCVVGRSGSGKTTLLNIVGALDSDYSGSVVVCGHSLRSLDDRRLSRLRAGAVGFVFQEPYLIDGLDAIGNVLLASAFTAGTDRLPRQAVEARAEELLEEVGLGGRRSARPTELSGGERQRLCLARALLNRPRLLLCDEPTGNLDEESAAAMVELLGGLSASNGAAVVVATHDRGVTAVADRVLRLHGGRLEPVAGGDPGA